MNLKVKLCRPGARLPTYATAGAACFDLYAVVDHPGELFQGTGILIPTGLIFDIPEDYVLMIFSRSGHGFNHDVRLANCVGLIDSDYRGEVMVKLTRDESPGSWLDPFKISQGDRIAQGMLMPVSQVKFEEVDTVESTVRGESGMGSTGR